MNDKFDVLTIWKEIIEKNKIKNYISFIVGLFLTAFTFSLFYHPNNIVCGGTTGLSVIVDEIFGVNPSLFIAIASLILLIFCLIFLGWEITIKTVVGTLLYPLFIAITDFIVPYINFSSNSLFLSMFIGGITYGVGTGLMLRTGFSSGGSTIICLILNKYAKVSIGSANIIINFFILLFGAIVFGIDKTIYALITIFICSYITDRVVIGVSKSKTFHIVTSKEEEVKDLIINKLGHTATIVESRGGYSNKKNKLILATIPTKEYFLLKEVVLEIDKNAFFLITDTYEVKGGV